MSEAWPFGDLKRGHYGAIYADPPWTFETYGSQKNAATDVNRHYRTMAFDEMEQIAVHKLAADDCVLFMWMCWPSLLDACAVIERWGFTYKTCAFAWLKADVSTIDLFPDAKQAHMTTGYWTRSNSEVCLLATRGKPKRINADVRQGIIEPRREHSRKPDCVYQRIERLVAGPYCELFARTTRAGWDSWGNETNKFKETA